MRFDTLWVVIVFQLLFAAATAGVLLRTGLIALGRERTLVAQGARPDVDALVFGLGVCVMGAFFALLALSALLTL